MESRMEAYLNAAISGNTENLPNPISRIDFLLCELIKTLGESGASIEEVEKIVTDKVAEIVADAPKDFDTLKELSDWIYTHEESAAAMNTAIQSNTNSIESLMTDVDKKINSDDVYDKATADSRFLGINDTASKAIADENGENIAENFAAVKNDIVINKSTLGYQRKNLLKNNSITTTLNGITFTVNDDKSITVSGKNTSSSTIFYNICKVGDLSLEIGKNYIMTGCPVDNKSSDNKMLCYLRADSSIGVIASDTGNGVTFTTSETSNPNYVIICISANAELTDPVTFYPMIRYAVITDDTYEPYVEDINTRLNTLLSRIEALENNSTA